MAILVATQRCQTVQNAAKQDLTPKTVIVIGGSGLGRGSDELGASLMANFLRKLWAAPAKPGAIVFYNSGVHLLVAGADGIDAVNGLASAGVDIVACGTCVSYFQVADRLVAGRISDMQEIVSLLLAADRTITV